MYMIMSGSIAHHLPIFHEGIPAHAKSLPNVGIHPNDVRARIYQGEMDHICHSNHANEYSDYFIKSHLYTVHIL